MKRCWTFMLTACLVLMGCRFFPESYFDLSEDSRLPKWFVLPQGMSRSDVRVQLYYYTDRSVELYLLTRHGRTIDKVEGRTIGNRPLTLDPNGSMRSYPHYQIITINGVSELIEHRERGSIFYLNDDPNVRAALGLPRP